MINCAACRSIMIAAMLLSRTKLWPLSNHEETSKDARPCGLFTARALLLTWLWERRVAEYERRVFCNAARICCADKYMRRNYNYKATHNTPTFYYCLSDLWPLNRSQRLTPRNWSPECFSSHASIGVHAFSVTHSRARQHSPDGDIGATALFLQVFCISAYDMYVMNFALRCITSYCYATFSFVREFWLLMGMLVGRLSSVQAAYRMICGPCASAFWFVRVRTEATGRWRGFLLSAAPVWSLGGTAELLLLYFTVAVSRIISVGILS